MVSNNNNNINNTYNCKIITVGRLVKIFIDDQ